MYALLLAWACADHHDDEAGTHPHDSGSTPTATAPPEALTDGGTWRVRYATDPDPIPLNDYFDLTLSIFDGETGTLPATDLVSLSFDAGMPDHGHGMNVQPTLTDLGGGQTLVEGLLFHMEGAWAMTVQVTGTGGMETATFDVDCCE